MIPPTRENTAKIVLSSGTMIGDDERRSAAAAGVTRIESTKSEPTICTETATARPSSSMKYRERKRVGTPRAAETSASTLENIRGRHTTARPSTTTIEMAINEFRRGSSTATIWPVSNPNLL